jgi:bacterioferritin-associated ferredoxin
MYVCVCAAVTDRQLRESSAASAAETFGELCRKLGVAQQCGRCAAAARAIVGLDRQTECAGAPVSD